MSFVADSVHLCLRTLDCSALAQPGSAAVETFSSYSAATAGSADHLWTWCTVHSQPLAWSAHTAADLGNTGTLDTCTKSNHMHQKLWKTDQSRMHLNSLSVYRKQEDNKCKQVQTEVGWPWVDHEEKWIKNALKALPKYSSNWCIVFQTYPYNLQNIALTKFPKSYN